MRIRNGLLAVIAGGLLAAVPLSAGAATKTPPLPTVQQINTCTKAVTAKKPMTAKQVTTCKAAVWQVFVDVACPRGAPGYLIRFGLGSQPSRQWAIRNGHRAVLVKSKIVHPEQIVAAVC